MVRRGRPRSFDRDEALRRALQVFRTQGYEGATLTDLQAAMGGITAPSLYAAFGSKEELFREAVALYRNTAGVATICALTEQSTARASIEAMLRAAADAFCNLDEPRGCLIVLGAIHCTRAGSSVQDHLRAIRLQTSEHITQRLKRGVEERDLPAGVDIAALASFYTTFLHGLSIQAWDGASRESLMAAIDCAMAAWDNVEREDPTKIVDHVVRKAR